MIRSSGTWLRLDDARCAANVAAPSSSAIHAATGAAVGSAPSKSWPLGSSTGVDGATTGVLISPEFGIVFFRALGWQDEADVITTHKGET